MSALDDMAQAHFDYGVAVTKARIGKWLNANSAALGISDDARLKIWLEIRKPVERTDA